MSLTVKAKVVKPGDPDPEIRRFAVDQDVSANYVYLRGKVMQMFPALKNKGFDLFWKDNEEDLIAFSSDDELTEALGYVSDGVFKIFIKETDKKPSHNAPDPVLHPNVVCDGCEGPVIGYRFKCMTCPDYDLCSSCENKGCHPEHDMMRITTPGSAPWLMFTGMYPPPPYHHGQGPPPPHFGRGGHGPWGHGPRGRGHPFHRMMNKCRRWMTGEDGCQEKKEKDTKKTAEEKAQKSGDKDKKSPPPQREDGQDEENSGDESPTENFLRNIGQNVAAMLDPLGIDVEIDVEHNGNRQSCGQPSGQNPDGQNQYGPWTFAGGPCGFWPPGGDVRPRQEGKRSDKGKTDKDDSTVTGKNTAPDVEMETGETKITTETKKTTEDESSTMDTQDDESTQNETRPKSSDAPSPDREWTFIDSRQENSSLPQEGATGGLYPQVPEPEPTTAVPPTNPVIANALDHMSAMGFTDDGGWLTRLLEVSGGDINKALDAIRANRAK